MNQPDIKGNFDAGTHQCDCGSRLFLAIRRFNVNGCEAMSQTMTWIQCAFCRTIWGFDRDAPTGWRRWSE